MNANSLIKIFFAEAWISNSETTFNSFYEPYFALGEVIFKSGKEKSWNEQLTITV